MSADHDHLGGHGHHGHHGGHGHHDHHGGHGHHGHHDHGKHNMSPLGVDMYLGLVYNLTGKTAPDLHLLDCGCGPGTYVNYLLEHGLGKATIIDSDEKVLESAEKLLENHKDKVTIKCVALPELPFPDASFDVVTLNYVVHHVYEPESQDYSSISKSLIEVRRVLKPKGVIIINETTPLQAIIHWAPIYPSSINEFLPLVLTSEAILKLLEDNGFPNVKTLSIHGDKIDPEKIYTGDSEPFVEDKGKLPDYKTMVECISSAEERKRLHPLANCLNELKDMVGRYNIYLSQKI